MHESSPAHRLMAQRFRGFLPIVVDIETGGFNAKTDAILEIAISTLTMTPLGTLIIDKSASLEVKPFAGAIVDPATVAFHGIDPNKPNRQAVTEEQALKELLGIVRKKVKEHECTRAVLVGHNAHFDLGFLNAAIERCNIKRSPFHPFSCFDTATLSGLAYGQTVLARACEKARIEFSADKAHRAAYDTQKTAELFCGIVNQWKSLGGWRDSNH